MVLLAVCTNCGKKRKFSDMEKYHKWREKNKNCPKCEAPLNATIRTRFVED